MAWTTMAEWTADMPITVTKKEQERANLAYLKDSTRLERAGDDEMDGDHLDIDWNPTYYTPATTPAEAANVDDLAAHLYGIDQKFKPSTARAHATSNQNIDSSTDTQVALGTEDWDAQGEFAGNKFVATEAGYYLVSAGVTYETPVADKAYSAQSVQYDSGDSFTGKAAYSTLHAATTTVFITPTVCDVFYLAAGEALKLWTWHNSGATEVILAGYNRTWLSVIRIA